MSPSGDRRLWVAAIDSQGVDAWITQQLNPLSSDTPELTAALAAASAYIDYPNFLEGPVDSARTDSAATSSIAWAANGTDNANKHIKGLMVPLAAREW